MKKTGTLLILLFALNSQAQTRLMGEVRETFNSARSLAMGGASIAVVNDETALLHNPAGLGKLRDFYGTLLDPEIDASSKMTEFHKAQAFTNPIDPAEVAKTLNVTRETPFHTRTQIFPSMVVRNFGIGLFGRYIMDAQMNAAGTSMDTFYQSDYALLLGYNLRLWEGRIKIGITGKAIARVEIDKMLDPAGDLTVAGNASEGLGIGADAGLILTAPWTWLPTVSAVVRDVGGTNFEAGSGIRMTSATRPNKVEQDIDVAVALFPIHGASTRSSFTLEYSKIKEAGQASDKSKYYHVGYELNYADMLFFRLGMNQRYATGGIELASENTQIQLTTYGEDVGLPGTPVEDRRYVLKFSLRF